MHAGLAFAPLLEVPIYVPLLAISFYISSLWLAMYSLPVELFHSLPTCGRFISVTQACHYPRARHHLKSSAHLGAKVVEKEYRGQGTSSSS